jgi:DNA adenine methylase
MNPVIKWVGGKRQLLPIIKQYIPKEYNTYFEPFVGGGALLFDLQPKKAAINDLNFDVYNLYKVIRDNPQELIDTLEQFKNTEEDFYKIRSWDRIENWQLNYTPVQIAARMLYLNRTCYNGLYRLNSKGQFNSPYGHYRSVSFNNLLEVSEYLKHNYICITNVDFVLAVQQATNNDFIYFDPPYDPVSDTANFTAYTKEGFDKLDQVRLRDKIIELSDRGCYCMLSNAGTDFIKELYRDFYIVDVQARRSVNCNGDSRGKVSEVLIMNYNNQTGE